MQKLERGQPYPIPVPEGVHLTINASGATLLLGYNRPTSDEIQAARNGVAQLALVPLRLSVILAYRLGTQPWSDAPFAIGRLGEDAREALLASPAMAGEVPDGTGMALHIILVDSSSNLIKGLRMIVFSTAQTRALSATLRQQAERPWNPIAEEQEQDALYARWPSDRLPDHPDAA